MRLDATDPKFRLLVNQFNQSLKDCHRLYLESAEIVIDCYPDLLTQTPSGFRQMMDDLHRGLLVKIFVSLADVDSIWSPNEETLASVLFFHLWQRRLSGDALRNSIRKIKKQSQRLQWEALVHPYRGIAPLREKMAELETIVVRLGNILTKCDGVPRSLELEQLYEVQKAIFGVLHSQDAKPDDSRRTSSEREFEKQNLPASSMQFKDQSMDDLLLGVVEDDELVEIVEVEEDTVNSEFAESTGPTIEEAIEELGELIGLENAKEEINTLVNFLKVQKMRRDANLPETQISLHMVFCGNPGTGKTTVARILGKIYRAMGILEKGHLIETDRSGLVAEFAGQTAPKTNKIVDEALDGVLFVDEAYSLVASSGDDPYGLEAIQTLLKRMEDNRDRIIVIMAGYPDEMDTLLKSNPGLSSRFNYRISFEDYSPGELGRIFGMFCEKNQYQVRPLGQAKLLLGFQQQYETRDKHFGNGRMVRNIFESSVRQLANRIVRVSEITPDILTLFEPQDITITLPDSHDCEEALANSRFYANCPHCQNKSKIRSTLLGRRVKCKKCEGDFACLWCQPVDSD